MKRKDKKIKVFLVLALILCITVGYAALTTTLNITGNSVMKNAKWDIHFVNLKVDGTSVEASTPATIDGAKTTVNYAVNLVKPGDVYSFTVDVVNEGSIDGMIRTVTNTGLTTDQQKYAEYSITYNDGAEVKAKDGIKAGGKRNIKVKVKYKDNLNPTDLPQENKTLTLIFTVEYVQADDTAVMPIAKVCKRATTLHTEECTDPYASCSAAGYTSSGSKGTTTITYGSLGTNGTLSSGNAFDCDVNNDGTYDPVTERFYYVSPTYEDGKYSDSYVTLIYYNNTTNGLPDNTTASLVAYDSSDKNYYGPRSGYVNLPSVSQWSHPNLVANMTRQIRTETGTTSTIDGVIERFTYADKATRFLTTQELGKACNITVGSWITGELDSCNYLMENTVYSNSGLTYGYWLESPSASGSASVWYVNSIYRFSAGRNVNYFTVGTSNIAGSRPAITVLKSKISY